MDRKIVKVATPIPPGIVDFQWFAKQIAENITQAKGTAQSMGGVLGEMKVLLVIEQETLLD